MRLTASCPRCGRCERTWVAPTSSAQMSPFSLLPFLSFFFSPRSELSGAAAVAAGRSGRRRRSRAARLGGGGAARQGAWTGAARQRRRGSSIPGIRPRRLAPRRSHRRRRRRALHRRRRAPDPPPRGAAAACLPGLRAPPSAGRTTGQRGSAAASIRFFIFYVNIFSFLKFCS